MAAEELEIQKYPTDPDSFYAELTTRNRHFVPPEVQKTLRKLRVLIAGCGSTGGACIESLARLGVENFALADNGSYELNNLNRQHALLENLGQNKAEFHAMQLRKINPFVKVQVHPEGIDLKNAEPLVRWADIVMDAVDVTTPGGITMKLNLHVRAKEARKPTLTALDLGFCQYGKSYDYRKPSLDVLDGRWVAAKRAKHPMKALFSIVPLRVVPPHCLPLLKELLLNQDISASQLGATSDLLSSIIVATMIRFADTGELLSGWNINLEYQAIPFSKRVVDYAKAIPLRAEIASLLSKAP